MIHDLVKNDFYKTTGLLVLTALLLALANPAFDKWNLGLGFFLAYFGFIPALICLQKATHLKTAFLQGLFWGFLYHLLIIHWFTSLHPMMWVGFSAIQSYVAAQLLWIVASLVEGVFYAVMWSCCYLVMRQYRLPVIIKPFLMGMTWALSGSLIHQFMPCATPVGFIAYSQFQFAPFMHSTYYLSFWGLEAMLFAANAYLVWPITLYNMSLGKILWIFSLALPYNLGVMAEKIPVDTSLKPNDVLIAQTPVTIESFKDKHYDPLTLVAAYRADIIKNTTAHTSKIIVLPEAVLPSQDTLLTSIPKNSVLLAGGYHYQNNHVYNSLIIRQDNQPQQIINKRILVSFGETTPLVSNETMRQVFNVFGLLYQAGLDAADFNQPVPVIRLYNNMSYKIGAFICFEALYPNLNLLHKQQGVNLLVTVSNLAWFHNNPQLQKQFLVANQFRAAELRVPLILATIQGDNKTIIP